MASIRRVAPFFQNRLVGCSRRAGTIGEGSIPIMGRYNTNTYSTTMRSLSSSPPQPVIEIREDFLFPQHSGSYFETVAERCSGASVAHHPPNNLCFLSRQELGGDANVATHAYWYRGGLAELQEQAKTRETENEIINNDLRACIQSQHRSVYIEAPLVKEQSDFVIGLGTTMDTMAGTANNNNKRNDDEHCILELRRYHLRLGYDTVPRFLELYGAGLPSKLRAPGTDPGTSLVTLLYSEVGRLNEVIEVWRHGNGVPGMDRSRVAARNAQDWRAAIASIADLAIEFRSTIHRPLWTAFPAPGNK